MASAGRQIFRPRLSALLAFLAVAYSSASWCLECTPSFPTRTAGLAATLPIPSRWTCKIRSGCSAIPLKVRPTQITRAGSRMVANSIAISTCRDGIVEIHYYAGTKKSGGPQPFFDSAASAYRYWPMDGFVYDHILYVALYQVATKPGGGPFGFELRGVTLARIANPGDDPRRWSVAYVDLASDGVVFPGVAAVVSPPWVYLFAVLADDAQPNHPLILTRLALDASRCSRIRDRVPRGRRKLR